MKVWNWLACFVRLCSVMRCAVFVWQVYGADPSETGIGAECVGGTWSDVDDILCTTRHPGCHKIHKPIQTSWHQTKFIEILQTKLTKAPNPRPFACRRGVTPQSYLAGSWVHGRLSHYTTSLFEAHGFPFFSRPSWMLEDVEFALPWMDTQIL